MTPSAPVKYILCDFGGTLMNTVPFYAQINREIVTQHGGDPVAVEEEMNAREPKPFTNYWRQLYTIIAKHCGRPDDVEDIIDLAKDRIHARFHECEPVPYALDLVNKLADSGATLVICSNVPKRQLEHRHAHLIDLNGGVDPFKYIFSAQGVAAPKPAPDLYLNTLKRLGTKPEECVALEDSDDGLCAATLAKIPLLLLDNNKYQLPDIPGATKVKSWKDISPTKLLAGDYSRHSRQPEALTLIKSHLLQSRAL